MISFNIIREDIIPIAQVISSFEFVGGEDRVLACQIINKYDSSPYLISNTATAEITLQTTDSNVPVVKSATIHTSNSSIVYVSLSAADTQNIIAGRISIKIVDGADTKISVRNNILSKIRL